MLIFDFLSRTKKWIKWKTIYNTNNEEIAKNVLNYKLKFMPKKTKVINNILCQKEY